MIKLVILILFFLIIVGGCAKKEIEEIPADQGVALIGKIIDGTGSKLIEEGVLLFKNGIIEAVGSKESITIPEDYLIKTLEGKTILPGFINSHVHGAYNEERLQTWARAGVTSVRELSYRGSEDVIEVRNRLNKNKFNAHIVSSTPIITVSGGYGSLFVDTPEQAIDVVTEYINRGIDIIKFAIEDECMGSWNIMSQDIIDAIVETTHAHNKRVAVHITWSRNLKFAIKAGVDEVSHMVCDQVSDELIQEMVENNIYWVPTLELWSLVDQRFKTNFTSRAISNVDRFYLARGQIAFGTDFGGFSGTFDSGFPITEVRFMEEAGMSNMSIIIAGTKNAAIVCDILKTKGTLEVGKDADILIVDGNPLDNIEALTNTFWVIREGQLILK